MKSSRRGAVLGSVVIAGIAYVLGARAGRARYDQIMEKAKSAQVWPPRLATAR
jgi:membrane protein DedA with SNARE-associated domain